MRLIWECCQGWSICWGSPKTHAGAILSSESAEMRNVEKNVNCNLLSSLPCPLKHFSGKSWVWILCFQVKTPRAQIICHLCQLSTLCWGSPNIISRQNLLCSSLVWNNWGSSTLSWCLGVYQLKDISPACSWWQCHSTWRCSLPGCWSW